NRQRIAESLGFPFEQWTFAEQVHGSDVAVVTGKERGKGTKTRSDALEAKDAFITNETGICMAALFADCVPLFYYDPDSRAVGLAHAGWKGTVKQVAEAVVRAMRINFNSKPERLIAAIGPSIGRCCYEVGEEV